MAASIASHKELRRQTPHSRRKASKATAESRRRGGGETAVQRGGVAAIAADSEANKKLFLFDL